MANSHENFSLAEFPCFSRIRHEDVNPLAMDFASTVSDDKLPNAFDMKDGSKTKRLVSSY